MLSRSKVFSDSESSKELGSRVIRSLSPSSERKMGDVGMSASVEKKDRSESQHDEAGKVWFFEILRKEDGWHILSGLDRPSLEKAEKEQKRGVRNLISQFDGKEIKTNTEFDREIKEIIDYLNYEFHSVKYVKTYVGIWALVIAFRRR